ncbi:isochorismatase family protein [Paraburkholderia sp. BCC1884]|uniref:isochorismatase family protein n=1 Tax=Paraburkholderia sp. BCC1884 TaxID=2562668 RepID=UPI00391EE445
MLIASGYGARANARYEGETAMLLNVDGSVLVLVDFQERLVPVIHQGDEVVREAFRLAQIAQILAVPVVGTEQNPRHLGSNVHDLKRLCSQTLIKHTFDATSAGLVEILPAGTSRVLLAGCESHVCVLQTAFGLLERDIGVTVVRNAVGSRKQSDLDVAMVRLDRAGVELTTVEMIAFEWMRTCDHTNFRQVLRLVK